MPALAARFPRWRSRPDAVPSAAGPDSRGRSARIDGARPRVVRSRRHTVRPPRRMRETPDSACHGLVDTVTGGGPGQPQPGPAGDGPADPLGRATSRSASAASSPSTASPSRWRPARSWGSSDPTARGRPRSSTACRASTRPSVARSSSRGVRSTASPPHRIPALGISRTFQNLALFPSLSVLQNVMIGRALPVPGGTSSRARSGFRPCGSEEARIRARARELVAFFGLEARGRRIPPPGSPFGTLKRVELARALAAAAPAPPARRAGGGAEPRGGRGAGPAHPGHPGASAA